MPAYLSAALMAATPRSSQLPPPPLHTDAMDYLDRIIANGGTMRSQDVNAFSAWATAIAPIRSKILHYSPVAGNNLAAAQVKFYKDAHESSYILGSTGFNDSHYSAALGLLGGAGRSLDSGFTPSLSGMKAYISDGIYSAGLGCWVSANNSPSGGSNIDMGAFGTANQSPNYKRLVMYANAVDTSSQIFGLFVGGQVATSGSPRTGFIMGNTNGASHRLFDNGSIVASDIKLNTSDERPDFPVLFLALNDNPGGSNTPTPSAFSLNRARHFILTTGLTDSEAALLSGAIATLQAVLSS